jgi:hypothetical protein
MMSASRHEQATTPAQFDKKESDELCSSNRASRSRQQCRIRCVLVLCVHATIPKPFGKPTIRAKTPFRVKHLHGNLCLGAAIDAWARTVDNRG